MGNYTSDQKTSRFFGLKLNNKTDADIIEILEAHKSDVSNGGIQRYIKTLIRADMVKTAAGSKPFRTAPGKYSCGICGTELLGKQRYCGNCGQPILWGK